MVAALLLRRRTKQEVTEGDGTDRSSPSPGLPLRFGHADALERLKNHSADHYAGLYNVMKGVTLAAAGLTLIRLSGGYPAQRLPLFAIGLLAIVITYNGAIIGQTVVHLRTSLADVLLPMGLTVAEFLVIGLAAARPKTAAIPEYWFLALGCWQILAACVVASVTYRLKEEMYSPTLWPTVFAYRQRQRVDACVAGVTGVITLAFWVMQRDDLAKASTAANLLLLFTFITLIGAIANHERTRRQLEENLRT